MRPLLRPLSALLLIAVFAGSLAAPVCAADGELVPEPWVHETHEYNVPVDSNIPNSGMLNEKWSLEIKHGEVLTLLMAREMAGDNGNVVDYTFNVHYNVGGTQYIAQFMIMYAAFKVGGEAVQAPLLNCDGFSLTYTPVRYEGGVPMFYCNITYRGIQLYPDAHPGSTVDLTLCHRIVADWERTDIKVEALFDFANTTLYQPSSGNELSVGTEFAAEIHYQMMVHKAHAMGTEGPLSPASSTDGTLVYNLTLDSGAPLTMSRMQMKDQFTVTNSSASYQSTGYSSMDVSPTTHVVHGFPGLVYGDTLSLKSDPEITVFHDRVTSSNDPSGEVPAFPLLPIVIVAAVAAISLVVLVVRKRKRQV
jgi:hypothetical protein